MGVIIGILILAAGYLGVPWFASLFGITWEDLFGRVVFGSLLGLINFSFAGGLVWVIPEIFGTKPATGLQMHTLAVICWLCGMYVLNTWSY